VHGEFGAGGGGVGMLEGGTRFMVADPSVAESLQRTLERKSIDAADTPNLAQRVVIQPIGRHEPAE